MRLLAVLLIACSNQADDKQGGTTNTIWDPCGAYTGDHFFVNKLIIGIDPMDFNAEPWDWDGSGISNFWDEYGALIEFALFIASEGASQNVNLDLYVQLSDAFAPIIMSPYVSPDLNVYHYWGTDTYEYLFMQSNPDNTIWFLLGDYEVNMSGDDPIWLLEFEDRDLVFDDYGGWVAFDRASFRDIADCGQVSIVLTDDEMTTLDTRVRFIELEVESW